MTSRVGVVDWGIGGIALLAHLEAAAPGLDVVYWCDTGFTPYGLAPTAALAGRLRSIVHALADRGCTEVVLACNAASTVVDRLAGAPVPVRGIIDAGIASVPADLGGVVGVVGGRRTILGGQYRRGLAAPGRRIVQRVAQPLSAHIEGGRIGTPAFEADLHRIVAPLRGAEAVVLACTHYPAALDAFAAALPGTLLVDPAARLAADLLDRVAPGPDPGARVLVTTGDPSLLGPAAAAAWGVALGEVDVVSL